MHTFLRMSICLPYLWGVPPTNDVLRYTEDHLCVAELMHLFGIAVT